MSSGQIWSGFTGWSSSKTLLYMGVSGVGGLVCAKIDGWWNKLGMMSDKLDYLKRMSSQVDKLNESQDKLDMLVSCGFRDLTVQMEELQKLSRNIVKIEATIKDVRISDAHTFRELVRLLKEDLKKDTRIRISDQIGNDIASSDKLTVYAVHAAVVLSLGALGYGCLRMKGITLSDVLGGTKRAMARALSSVTNCLAQKSSAFTDKMMRLTDSIDNCGRSNQPKKKEDALEGLIMGLNQPQTDHLLTLVMEEGGDDFDEEFLGNFYDRLNGDHVAARGFISKTSNMRKKMLSDFFEESHNVNPKSYMFC